MPIPFTVRLVKSDPSTICDPQVEHKSERRAR